MTGTRINLWIYVKDEAGKTLYHTMHVGIFPTRSVPAIVKGLDARGLAYHSDYPGQIGIVDVATHRFGVNEGDIIARTFDYSPRHARVVA